MTRVSTLVPELGTKVRIEGRSELYILVYADHNLQLADLLVLDGTQRREEGVPLHTLRAVA